jgi:cytochrome c2
MTIAVQKRLIAAPAMACLLILRAGASSAQGEESGERIFRDKCSICHSLQPGRSLKGPSLFGVVGRHAGSMQGFHYSAANIASGLTWDPKTLDRYLASPREVVPGTLMTFPGLKDSAQRSALITFLSGLH